MMQVTDKKEVGEIIEMVKRYLEPHQPGNYRLVVVPEGIRRDDDWIYVLIEPTREDVPVYDYTGRMVEAEMDLENSEHKKILLVPTFGGIEQ